MKSEFTIGDVPVRLNADVFQTDFEKIQRASGDFNPVTYASGARVLSSASAEIRGLELEAVIRPLDALEIGADLSLLDAKYKKFPYEVTSPFGHQDCSGAVIPYGGRADLSCLPMQYFVDRIASVYVQVNFSDDVFCLIESDGQRDLLCPHHSALFRVPQGECHDGPCRGDRLTAVPLEVSEGVVRVATSPQPDLFQEIE